jgi:hypothetical protein
MIVTHRQAIAFIQSLGRSCSEAGESVLYIHLRAILGSGFWFDARTYSPVLWDSWTDGTRDNAKNLAAYLRGIADRLDETIIENDTYVEEQRRKKSDTRIAG